MPMGKTFIAVALVAAASVAWGQEGNRDYYAPRTENVDRQMFNNVERAHLQPGIMDMLNKRYASALENFEFILGFYPNHPQVLGYISDLCSRWSHPKCDANKWFERAIALNPKAPATYLALGVHFQRHRKLDDAVASYKRALELNPRSPSGHYNLALALVEQSKLDLANEHAQISYALGMPLQGLREILERKRAWRSIDNPLAKLAVPAAPGSSPAVAAPPASPAQAETPPPSPEAPPKAGSN